MVLQERERTVSLILLFIFIQTDLAKDTMNDCSQEIYDDVPQCPPSKTYVVNTDGLTCKVTLTSTNNCSTGEMEYGQSDEIIGFEGVGRGRKVGRQFSIISSRFSCKREPGLIDLKQIQNPTPNCYTYKVPVCQDGKYELRIQTFGGSEITDPSSCYGIKINDEVVSRALYFNLLDTEICPKTEVLIKLKVESNQTQLINTKKQKIHLIDNQFSLDLCFAQCGNKTGTLQLEDVSMNKTDRKETAKPCMVADPKIDCEHYNGTIPSICWSHGCQYYLDGKPRCAKAPFSCEANSYNKKCICSHAFCDHLDPDYCTEDPPIFTNKLTCRRADTYYVYHPKQHCYNDLDSGDCTATVIHAVNINGPAVTDHRGIRYMAGHYGRVYNPYGMAQAYGHMCTSIFGTHKGTKEIYNTMMGAWERGRNNEYERYFSYPIPICQSGEYMLTVKLMDRYGRPARCTEVRINNVQIMLHLDTYVLAGRKCKPVDAVVMFLAEGGDDNNPKSNRTLQLKGHVEPIHIQGGTMYIQFFYGYHCYDNNPLVSGFSLERLKNDTKPCVF